MNQLHNDLWGLLGTHFQTALTKAQASGTADPLSLGAIGAYEGSIPEGAIRSGEERSFLGRVLDFVVGALDNLTGGWFSRGLWRFSGLGLALTLMGFDLANYVDYNSSAYAAGGYAGQVISIAATLFSGGALGAAIRSMQFVGGVLSAGEAAFSGKIGAALGLLAGAVANKLTGCQASALLGGIGYAGNLALSGYSMYQSVQAGIARIGSGDILGGVLDIVQGAAGLYRASRACLTRETPFETKRGFLRMDELAEGDWVRAGDENDPNAPATWKRIVEIYRFEPKRIWHLHVEGRVIRTTDEHPFYVLGQGWTAAKDLRPGDLLRSENGRLIAVEEIVDSGVEEEVYNFAVEEYHTYFVAGADWGFSVWAHNDCGSSPKKEASGETRHTSRGRQAHKDYKPGKGYEKEVTLPSGKRVDAINWKTRTVKELKPNNPRAIRRGKKQLELYKKELEEITGETWTTKLDTYDP